MPEYLIPNLLNAGRVLKLLAAGAAHLGDTHSFVTGADARFTTTATTKDYE